MFGRLLRRGKRRWRNSLFVRQGDEFTEPRRGIIWDSCHLLPSCTWLGVEQIGKEKTRCFFFRFPFTPTPTGYPQTSTQPPDTQPTANPEPPPKHRSPPPVSPGCDCRTQRHARSSPSRGGFGFESNPQIGLRRFGGLKSRVNWKLPNP